MSHDRFGTMSELDILLWIQGASPWMDAPMRFVSDISAHAACWIAIAAIMLLLRRSRRTGIEVLAALLLAFLVVDLLVKPLVARDRPFEVYDFELIVGAPHSSSFPSGHSAYAFAAATCIALRDRRWGVPAFALALVIAYSRLYLFVHWPTDILAGAMIGIAIGFLAVHLVDRLARRPPHRLPGRRHPT